MDRHSPTDRDSVTLVVWDEDGVLFRWTEAFNLWLGWSEHEVWTTWDHYRSMGMSSAEFRSELDRFGQSGGFRTGRPYHDALIAHRLLASHPRIRNISCTAKPNVQGFFDAGDWLIDHGVRMESRLLAKDKTDALHYAEAARIETVFAIDDLAENVRSLRSRGVNAFLRSQPWNTADRDVPRVESAIEFANIVLETAGGHHGHA